MLLGDNKKRYFTSAPFEQISEIELFDSSTIIIYMLLMVKKNLV